MINQRLFDHYGIDTTKNLKIKNRCPRPYDTILVDKQGSCYACECTSWLPQSVGNLQLKSLDEIINSKMQQHLQSSIADSTYRFCNEHQCSYIKAGTVLHDHPEHIQHLRLAIDDSCNLQCPSCRKGMIFHKEGSAYNLRIKLADKINSWLARYEHPIQVHIGSDGDPFASHVYRHFMEHTPKRDNIKYSILTNGLMFKEFNRKIPHVIDNLHELGVSIDGASKDTYEKLRMGGKWDKINENLEYISELKHKHQFRFTLYFVVQKDNYHEMEDIVSLGEKYNADRVWLSRIQDWNTWGNFSEHNIFDNDHPLHKNYTKSLNRLIAMKSSLVEEATLRQLH
jgi:wyosine [tRNA(Phe)-imidazoG37] synthetase (radical SAM superfamily)